MLGLDLAVEPLDGVGRLQRGARNHLHRHYPLHSPMLSLEHHAHSALPEFVEDTVVPEDQPFDLSLIDYLGLVLGEFVGLHQCAGQGFAVLGTFLRREAVLKRRDFRGRQQPAVGQVLHELFERDAHGYVSNPLTRCHEANSGDYTNASEVSKAPFGAGETGEILGVPPWSGAGTSLPGPFGADRHNCRCGRLASSGTLEDLAQYLAT